MRSLLRNLSLAAAPFSLSLALIGCDAGTTAPVTPPAGGGPAPSASAPAEPAKGGAMEGPAPKGAMDAPAAKPEAAMPPAEPPKTDAPK